MIDIKTILFLFTLWNIIGFAALLIIPYSRDAKELSEIFNPKEIYANIKVNWFGCTLLTIIFNLLCPAMTIYYWLHLLCTIGRKPDYK